MFTDPKDLARAALELLDSARNIAQTPSLLSAIELGAATTANHIWDWHEKTRRPPHDRSSFAAMFPAWDLLRQISNGFKHPKSKVDISQAALRGVEWEDADFWYADHGRSILFVEVDGNMRAISALVRTFATDYIAKA